MRVLFFHNTIAEYRLPFFEELSKKCDLEICLTDSELSKTIYNTSIVESSINALSIEDVPNIFQFNKRFKEKINKNYFDVIVLPTLDTSRDAFISWVICKNISSSNTRLGYFWEKWTADKECQPILKRIKNNLQAYVAHLILKDVDVCWYPGKCTKSYYESLNVPAAKLYKIHDCSLMPIKPQNDNFFKTLGISKEEIVVLYFGRLIERKGLGILIEAFSRIERENYALVIAGDGELKKNFEQQVKNLNMTNVYFVGEVNPKDRYDYFSNSDIFVLPSIIHKGIVEAWGLTLNEAVQCHKYIISTDAVGSAFELIDDLNGEIIPQNNVDRMVEALVKAKDKYNEESVKKKSISLMEMYNYKTMAEDILKSFV